MAGWEPSTACLAVGTCASSPVSIAGVLPSSVKPWQGCSADVFHSCCTGYCSAVLLHSVEDLERVPGWGWHSHCRGNQGGWAAGALMVMPSSSKGGDSFCPWAACPPTGDSSMQWTASPGGRKQPLGALKCLAEMSSGLTAVMGPPVSPLTGSASVALACSFGCCL